MRVGLFLIYLNCLTKKIKIYEINKPILSHFLGKILKKLNYSLIIKLIIILFFKYLAPFV